MAGHLLYFVVVVTLLSSIRLDRLFILLESGGTAATRRAAAKQLGDVVKGQSMLSAEVRPLLLRLLQLLSSKSWDTRVAAASAIGAVLESVKQWWHESFELLDEYDEDVEITKLIDIASGIATVAAVLQRGHQLQADDDSIYSTEQDDSDSSDVNSRLQRQRLLLNQRLGLDVAASLGLDTSAIFSNEDLISSESRGNTENKTDATDLLPQLPGENEQFQAAGQCTTSNKRSLEANNENNEANKRTCFRPCEEATSLELLQENSLNERSRENKQVSYMF